MATIIEILGVEQDGKDESNRATFSDGTIGAYVVDELLELRPIRELAHRKAGRAQDPANRDLSIN